MTLRWPVILAWTTVALEGFDLVVIGSILPTLSKDWKLTGNDGSVISTSGLIGVAIGAVLIGIAADRWGRRPALLGCVAWFSVLTLLCAFAPGLFVLSALRFLAGLALGGCLPVALAMAAEYAPTGGAGSSVTRIMTGYHSGAVLTALLAIPVVDDFGWRPMFFIGGLLGLAVLPVMFARLPESATYLHVNGRSEEARELAGRYGVDSAPERAEGEPRADVRSLLKGEYLRPSLAFWTTSFMGLLLVYGLNTWLPTIMAKAGYELSASLAMLLTLNVGAVCGLVVAGALADRSGIRPITIGWFGLAAAFLALLSIKLPLTGVYVVVFAAGLFVFSAQVLVYAYVSQLYPAEIRATAIGFSSGIGRVGAIVGPIVVGLLVTADLQYPGGFYFFAAVAVAGLLAMTAVPAVTSRRSVRS